MSEEPDDGNEAPEEAVDGDADEPEIDPQGPPPFDGVGRGGAVDRLWEEFMGDVETTAAEYREAGWETIECHPGDVAPLLPSAERYGLDVLVPDSEADAVAEAFHADDARFESCEVYSAVVERTMFTLVVVEDPGRELAVLIPTYYDLGVAEPVIEAAEERGQMQVHVRDLDEDHVLTFVQDDPSLFRPDPDQVGGDAVDPAER